MAINATAAPLSFGQYEHTQEMQAKAAAAVRWCRHAFGYAATVGGKPRKYLLVPAR